MLNSKRLLLVITSSFLISSPLSSMADEVVVQAGDPETSSTGRWYRATGATMPYEGNRGMYTLSGGPAETYTFTPDLPETNLYEVQVYNSCYAPRSHQVTHRIYHAGGVETLVLEQDCTIDPYVGQWRPLGSFSFNAGTEGSVVIDTEGSNNSYVGATAVRFIFEPGIPDNYPPVISLSEEVISVSANETVVVTGTATDAEDGDLSGQISWHVGEQTFYGASLTLDSVTESQTVLATVSDSDGVAVSASVSVNVVPAQQTAAVYDFCGGLTPLVGFTTNKAEVLPDVGMQCGRYIAKLFDNSNNQTLHYHEDQGRFDGVPVTFPFDVIARNVGTSPIDEPTVAHTTSGSAYTFAGLQVHHPDLNNTNSAHLVVGQRGNRQNTIEGKMTRNGRSYPNDIGSVLPNGRADLRIVGNADGTIEAYWQLPNLSGDTGQDSWIPYNGSGNLPGYTPIWGGNTVYIGLITYAYGSNGIPFMGVVDALEIQN